MAAVGSKTNVAAVRKGKETSSSPGVHSGGGCSPDRTSLSLQIGEKQGDSGDLQRGAKRNPAKSHQISRVWMGVSLLKEQGDYHCSAGT
jgi:hypothetical protein